MGKHKAAAVWQHFYPSPATVVGCHFPTQAELIRNNSRALNGKQANAQSTTPTPKKPTRRAAVTPSAAEGTAETHAKMQRERCSVPNMAESPSQCGHPGSGHWGHEDSRGTDAHSPGSGRMRSWPSVTKASPTRSGKTQLSTRLARAARYVNRIHLSKGLEGAGFSGPGQSCRARGGPVRCPGAESAERRPLRPVPALVAARNPLRGPRPAGRRRLPGRPRPRRPVRGAGSRSGAQGRCTGGSLG